MNTRIEFMMMMVILMLEFLMKMKMRMIIMRRVEFQGFDKLSVDFVMKLITILMMNSNIP